MSLEDHLKTNSDLIQIQNELMRELIKELKNVTGQLPVMFTTKSEDKENFDPNQNSERPLSDDSARDVSTTEPEEEEVKEKPKKKKVSKKEKIKEEPEPEDIPEEEESEELPEEEEVKPATKDDVRKALGLVQKKHGRDAVYKVLGMFNASVISQVKESLYSDLVAKATKYSEEG